MFFLVRMSQSSRVLVPKPFLGPAPIQVGSLYSASVELVEFCHWKRRSVGVKVAIVWCTPCLDGESKSGTWPDLVGLPVRSMLPASQCDSAVEGSMEGQL